MTFWTKAAAKQKVFLPKATSENEREMERWSRREREQGEIHHLVQRYISCAWFILSKAPTMQMTHKVEIERLWSRCQE